MDRLRILLVIIFLLMVCVSCKAQDVEVPTCYPITLPYPDSKQTAELTEDELKKIKQVIKRASSHYWSDEYEEAFEDLDEALTVVSDDFNAYFVGTIFSVVMEEPSKALAFGVQAARVEPFARDVISPVLMTNTDAPLEYYSEALACLDANIELYASNPQAYFDRGMAYFALGYPEKALSDFEQALALDAKNVDIMYYASFSLWGLERYPEAIELMTKVISAESEKWEYYKLRGLLYEANNEISLAVRDFESMLEFCDTDDSCRFATNQISRLDADQ